VSFAATPLKILAEVTPTRTTVYVRGEVDMATAPQLRRELEHHLSHGPSELVIDCSGVSFMDSSGLHALLIARRTGDLIGCRMALTGTPPQVDKLLALVGVELPAARHLAAVPTTR
jgi:anti-sigma B factor antagonist